MGYLCAHPKFIEWLLIYRTVSEIAGSSASERIVYQLLSQGSYRHHCAQLRGRLDEHRQPVIEALGGLGLRIEREPDSGMYVWATLPHGIDAMAATDELLKQGHLLAPGGLFSSGPEVASRMRFNVSRTLNSPALPALERLIKARSRTV